MTDRGRIDLEEWAEQLRDCEMTISGCVERKEWDTLWEELPTLRDLAGEIGRVKKVLCEHRGGPWRGWHNDPYIDHDAYTRLSDALFVWAIPRHNDRDKWEFEIRSRLSLDNEGGMTLAEHIFDNPAEGRGWVSWVIKEHGKSPCAVCGGTGGCAVCEGSGFMGGIRPDKNDENSGLEPCLECSYDENVHALPSWGASRACAACGGTALEVDVDLSFERFEREKG
jgi:hypothetical protein